MRTIKEIGIEGETISQIFIENSNDSIEVAKSIVALANSKGGSLYIGIKKSGKIIGVFPDVEILLISDITQSICDPKISYTTTVMREGFRLILEISVLKSNSPPVYLINNGIRDVYIRKQGRTFKANSILENVLKYKSKFRLPPIELTQAEISIQNLINSNPKISLTQIYKKSKIPMKEIDTILVRLICWKLVYLEITENNSFSQFISYL
jgi:predicted HTH transcriptional regulator